MNLEETMQSIRKSGDETLYILWTNADRVTANLGHAGTVLLC